MRKIIVQTLTEEEKKIIIEKGTERPFTGEYWDTKESGMYYCRQCGHALYSSKDKFDSGCGWPSFDDAIPGAIIWTDDIDGMRTEITCAICGGHLGHVFIGEHLTEKNTRHCVNSLSMKFIPIPKKNENLQVDTKILVGENIFEKATFGGGCFWCIEAGIQKIKGVIDIKSGYSGGVKQFPTYENICSGGTGHIEVVQVIFDPKIISYETLLKVFFTLHDPTSYDQQGVDRGEQYRSVIFYHNKEQKITAENMIYQLTKDRVYENLIVTEIHPLERFWIAEGYHQNYYHQHSQNPYCQIVINPKLTKLRQEWQEFLVDDNKEITE